jgi:hypothetical protein
MTRIELAEVNGRLSASPTSLHEHLQHTPSTSAVRTSDCPSGDHEGSPSYDEADAKRHEAERRRFGVRLSEADDEHAPTRDHRGTRRSSFQERNPRGSPAPAWLDERLRKVIARPAQLAARFVGCGVAFADSFARTALDDPAH